MLDALTIPEAGAAGLFELAALDLAMARDFAARAQAAEDPDTANDLARSYQRMARSYRQTLALKVKLQSDMARAQRDTPPPPAHEVRRVHERVETVREAVQRVIWAEREAAEAADPEALDLTEDRFDRLDARLALLGRDP